MSYPWNPVVNSFFIWKAEIIEVFFTFVNFSISILKNVDFQEAAMQAQWTLDVHAMPYLNGIQAINFLLKL